MFLLRHTESIDGATGNLLRTLIKMPRLSRLSLALRGSPPPPASLALPCRGSRADGDGPHLTALDLSGIFPSDDRDDGDAVSKVRSMSARGSQAAAEQ